MAQLTNRPGDQQPYTGISSGTGMWCPTCRATATSECPHLIVSARTRRRMAAREAKKARRTQ